MDAEFVSRYTDTPRVPKGTHSSASKLPAVLEAESGKALRCVPAEGTFAAIIRILACKPA
jgi:hypothetical protein